MKKLNVLSCYLIHGLGGEEKNFIFVKNKIEEIFGKLFKDEEGKEIKNIISCFCPNANSGMKATFPLEVMFENEFKEFSQYFEENLIKELKKDEEKYNKFEGVECDIYISFAGHSLGGNVARGLITKLYSTFTKNDQTYENYFEYITKEYPFISAIKPCSYLSLSSPHLGSLVSEPNETTKFIKKTEKSVVKSFINIVLGEVGKELTFQDEKKKKNSNSKENINEVNENKKESKYALMNCCSKESMDALAKFPNRTLTAFLRYDLQVKYCSAMGCIETPLPNILENEKDILIPDKVNDTRIVMYSGFNEGPELEYYQKELFNEKVSKDFYYSNTKVVPSPDIDDQIRRALIDKREKAKKANNNNNNNTNGNNNNNDNDNNNEQLNNDESQQNETLTENYEEMEDEFLIDNDNQAEAPVALIKAFNQIPYRRITMDFVVSYGITRMLTHGLCLEIDSLLFRRAYLKMMAEKTKSFYGHLLISDFIRTSEQTENYSLLNLYENEK